MSNKAQIVTKDIAIAVPEPEFTKTWSPVGHGRIINHVDQALETMGIAVRGEQFTLTRGGKNLFAAYTLDLGRDDVHYNLGFRNAIDKRFALGFCSGTHIMVCSNMMFTGDWVERQVHDHRLTEERLVELVDGALGGAIVEMEKVIEWHEGLKEVWLPKRDFKEMTFDLMNRGAFSPSNFNNFLGSVADEVKTNDTGRTDVSVTELDKIRLFDVHGGVTRLARSWNTERQMTSSRAANQVADDYLARAA